MTHLWIAGNGIEVRKDDQDRIRAFAWKGRKHAVGRVHQHWQVDTDWWSDAGRVHRDYYALTTTDGLLCVIYRDFEDELWYIAKIYD
jgi:hypothetical protein